MRRSVAARRAPGRGPAPWRLCAILLVAAAAACGKKGPPLAPFPRVPAQVSGVEAERIADEVKLTIPVPAKNADGHAPADLEHLEVFAVTAMTPPETEEQHKLAALVATLPIRPVLPAATETPGAEPPPSLLPGFDQGASAVFRESLTPELRVPVEMPKPKGVPSRPPVVSDEPPFGPLVAPPPVDAGRRYYFVVAVSPRGRRSKPSAVVSVPFGDASGPPGAPEVAYTARELTIKWVAPPDARSATLPAVRAPRRTPTSATSGRPGAARQGTTAGGATPEPAPPTTPSAPSPPTATGAAAPGEKPAAPLPPPLLAARSIGFNTPATAYHVYEVPGDQPPDAAAAAALPKVLTPQPVVDTELTLSAPVYGVERCFIVRAVDRVGGVAVQGPASPRTCVTPADTFPPAPPQSLAAIGGPGVINLIWEPNSEPDLAGYIVLRGEAPGDTLQPLMSEPITESTFADRTARPGVRYVYAVVAVDKATVPNVSAQSNKVEEATRQ